MSKTERRPVGARLRLILAGWRWNRWRRRRCRRRTVERALEHLRIRARLPRGGFEWIASPAALESRLETVDRERLEALCKGIDELERAIVSRHRRALGEVADDIYDGISWLELAAGVSPFDRYPGQRETGWLPAAEIIERSWRSVLLGVQRLDLVALSIAARNTLCWLPASDRLLIVDRPRRLRRTPRWLSDFLPDARHLEFRDRTGAVLWGDRLLDPDALFDPTPADVIAEPNLFIRQLLLERYGVERFFRDAGARQIHEDAFGRLCEIRTAGEPLSVVRVVNSTAEPNGKRKEYFLRVPPGFDRARDAVAWTFGLSGQEYAPLIET